MPLPAMPRPQALQLCVGQYLDADSLLCLSWCCVELRKVALHDDLWRTLLRKRCVGCSSRALIFVQNSARRGAYSTGGRWGMGR